MTLVFLGQDNLPAYMALSTDVSANAISGAVLIGKTVLLTDTQAWKIILEDLTLADYVFPAGGSVTPTLTPSWLGIKKLTYPSSSGWSWDNQGSGTIDSTAGWEYQYCPAKNGVQLQLRYRTPANAHFRIDVAMLGSFSARQAVTNNDGFFFGFRDSTGKLVGFMDWDENSSASMSIYKWNSSSSGNSPYTKVTTIGAALAITNPVWYRIDYDGTNIKFYRTADTYHWELAYSVAITDFLSAGKPDVCWGSYCNASSFAVALVSYEETALP
jgi:hypothetical protein